MDLNLAGSKKKHRENKKYSIITLDLFKPTKNSYPEFDYEQICKQYLNEDESSGEDERFHDREAEMLCKRLEEKYGGKRDKKGRRIRLGTPDDFMDKSAGYDLSDPFIDDSEAYDEHVPSTMDTMKGGFYVNKGKLEFRPKYPLDSDSEDEQATVKKRTTEKRRRVLSDDEEEAASTSKPCTSKSNGEGFKKGDVSGSESTIETSSESLRLSAAGAPPSSSKGEGIANRRLLAQQLIKRRRLIGQPPSSKIASSASPTVKAAMGVKKKLKPQVKKTTVEGSADELAVFLKDMAGGEEIPLDNLEEGMDVLVKEVSRESPKASRSPSVTSVTDSEAVNEKELPDEEKKDERAREASAPSSTPVSPTKRPIGRPPVSATYSLSKPMPAMSDKLSCMIETFKQKTREYGAPTKKIRIPPSLVDLCIRIEEQCSAEGFNHHQKTRVFDMLSNWVSVQRNSLYIRMKAFKDRRAIQQQLMTPENGVAAAHAGTASVVALCSSSSEGPDDLETKSSFISVSGQPTPATQNVIKEMESVLTEGAVESGELLKAAKTSANGTTVTTAESSSTPKTAQRLAQDVTPKAAGEVSANSALREVTQAAEGVKPNNTPVSASSSAAGSLTKIRTGHSATGALASAQKTPMSNAKGESSASLTKQGSSLKTPLSSSAKSSPPQNPLASLAAANPQMLQLLSAMLQQQSQGTNDPQQQQQNLAAGLAALQMNAAMMAANQQTEAIAQYQLALNNLAKLSVVAPQQQQQVKVQKKLVSSSAKGGVVKQKKALLSTPLSAPSVTRLMPSTMAERMASLSVINSAKAEKAVSRNESAKQRQAAVPPATASSSCSASVVNMPPKQSPAEKPKAMVPGTNEKVAQALAVIKKAADALYPAIGVAISYSDNEYEIEKKRAERDGLPLPQKRFRWIERVRSSLKQLVTVLFFNLEMQCPNAEDVYSTVVQYLHGNVLPYFKGRISFEELMAETVRLVPDRTQLRTCPRMASLIKTKTTDIKQSEPSSANTPHAASSLSADSQKAPSEHSKASSESKPVPQLKPASQSKMVPPPVLNKKNKDETPKSTWTAAAPSALTERLETQAQDGVRSQLEGDVNPQPLAQDNSEPKLANSANNIDESQVKTAGNVGANAYNQQRTKHDEQIDSLRSTSASSVHVTHERISQPIFNPKLTPGQKIILAREAEERERLLAEKAAREKAEREREERERERQKKLQEAREREEAENRKRDEEAIKKWEMEEAERLEAAAEEEEAERAAAAEAERKRLELEEAERRQLLEEKLEADRLEEERKRQEEIAAEQRRLEEQQREEEKRLEAEQEEQKRRERELELMRLQEAEQKRQEEIDDLLGSLSPLDSIEETKSLGELKEDSLERRQQQQQRRTFSAIEQAMSHESLHDPSTPSSCAYTALIESSPSSRDQQRMYGTNFGTAQHGSPMFQQASTPATASPQSVHSIPASPLQSSTRSPMQAIPSSPSPYNRIQYSPAGASSFQRYSTYQQQQLSTAQNLQQSPSQPNAHQGHQQMAQTWNQISSGQQDSFSNVMGGQTQIQQGMTMSHSQSNIQPSVIGVSRQAATTTGANIRQSDMLAQVQYGQLQQQQKQQMRQQLLQPQPQVVPQTPSQPLYQQPATQAFASQPADTGMNLQQAQPYGQQQQQTNFVGVGSYGNTRTAFQRTQSYEQASDIQTNVVASTHQQANVPSLMNSGVGSMIQHQQQQQQNVTSVSQTDMRPMQARTSAFLPATANPYMPAQQFVGNQQSQIYSQQQRQLVNQPHDQQHYMNYQQQQRQQQHYNNSQPWG